jgi:hypothetical protein
MPRVPRVNHAAAASVDNARRTLYRATIDDAGRSYRTAVAAIRQRRRDAERSRRKAIYKIATLLERIVDDTYRIAGAVGELIDCKAALQDVHRRALNDLGGGAQPRVDYSEDDDDEACDRETDVICTDRDVIVKDAVDQAVDISGVLLKTEQ